MKKYIYFILGYVTALMTIFMVSCTIAPLEAGMSELGSNEFNPMYVKIVE